MAVTLPSDLIVDVLRNADPARQRAALAKLEGLSESPEPVFAGVLNNTGTVAASLDELAPQSGPLASVSPSQQMGNAALAYQGFERMVLRNMFETLLPNEDSGAFGEGPSSGVWRSLAADQLAGVYANAGGIGIANTLASAQRDEAPVQQAQWPYFSLSKINSFSG
ncbi:MAG: rod-binding protein [Aestuariivirga sp.]|uniref:rod-binding protein n=1 Tax=Aestuariivirga sp. TaxID=2650926 RepID=UPI0038D1A18B